MLFLWLYMICNIALDPPLIALKGQAQGTTYSIKYVSHDSVVPRSEIDRLFQRIDHSLSLYDSSSLISYFNRNGKVRMDSYMFDVVQKSMNVHQESHGGFDITLRPLSLLWGFGRANKKSPSGRDIRKTLSLVGLSNLEIRGDSLIALKEGVMIDCNGIAQGYTVDLLSALLESRGIKNYIVELGGEVRAVGQPAQNRKWSIGIESPGTPHYITRAINLENKAVTTSGNYRNYVQYGKQKYGHIIDPHSGYPVNNGMISVTVMADNTISADAWDNAFFVMGWQASLDLLNNRDDLQAYFIYTDEKGNIRDTASLGFNKMTR
jgi:thiamine biosynthesis lipoprotein